MDIDPEALWNRIAGAAQKIAVEKKIDVPDDLLKTSGDIFERDRKRQAALTEFCSKAGIALSEEDSLAHLADKLDGLALKAMGVTAVTGEARQDKKAGKES